MERAKLELDLKRSQLEEQMEQQLGKMRQELQEQQEKK
jgi:hypothetical protein